MATSRHDRNEIFTKYTEAHVHYHLAMPMLTQLTLHPACSDTEQCSVAGMADQDSKCSAIPCLTMNAAVQMAGHASWSVTKVADVSDLQ